MKYYIHCNKGFWLKDGLGYTQDINEAGTFTSEELNKLAVNLENANAATLEVEETNLDVAENSNLDTAENSIEYKSPDFNF